MNHTNHRHFRRLELAQKALDFGARRTVIQRFTGLSEGELKRIFHGSPEMHANHGGAPSSPDKLFTNAVTEVHASHFYSYFHHLLHRGVGPDEALVVAYDRYRGRYAHDPRIDFDRAFHIVSWTCGLWTNAPAQLEAMRCAECGAIHLGVLGTSAMVAHTCPFCKTARDFTRSQRISRPLTQPLLESLEHCSTVARDFVDTTLSDFAPLWQVAAPSSRAKMAAAA